MKRTIEQVNEEHNPEGVVDGLSGPATCTFGLRAPPTDDPYRQAREDARRLAETVFNNQEKEREDFNAKAVETWQKKMKTMDQKKNEENIVDEVTVRFNLAPRERSGGNFTPEAVKIFQDQQEKRKKRKEGRNVQGFINTIAENIAQAEVDYLGEMPLTELLATTRLGVSRALLDHEKSMKAAGIIPDILDKPVYVVYTVTKTDTCPALIDKFIFSDLEMFRANLVCIDRLTAGAEKTFYGPGDKDKLLADTTPDQRARINDEFFFLDTLTSKYGAEFDLRMPLGQSSAEYFEKLSKKREPELTKKEVFILNWMVKKLNE